MNDEIIIPIIHTPLRLYFLLHFAGYAAFLLIGVWLLGGDPKRRAGTRIRPALDAETKRPGSRPHKRGNPFPRVAEGDSGAEACERGFSHERRLETGAAALWPHVLVLTFALLAADTLLAHAGWHVKTRGPAAVLEAGSWRFFDPPYWGSPLIFAGLCGGYVLALKVMGRFREI